MINLNIVPTTVSQDEKILLLGDGVTPNKGVKLYFGNWIYSADSWKADQLGIFRFEFNVGDAPEANYSVRIVDTSNNQASNTVVVTVGEVSAPPSGEWIPMLTYVVNSTAVFVGEIPSVPSVGWIPMLTYVVNSSNITVSAAIIEGNWWPMLTSIADSSTIRVTSGTVEGNWWPMLTSIADSTIAVFVEKPPVEEPPEEEEENETNWLIPVIGGAAILGVIMAKDEPK